MYGHRYSPYHTPPTQVPWKAKETLTQDTGLGVASVDELSALKGLISTLQSDLDTIRGSLDVNVRNGSSTGNARIGGTATRTATNTLRFTARFSGDGGAATPFDLNRQEAGTGDVMTWNGSYWTPSSLVAGGISSQNVSSGSVGAPSIYFGGNSTSGYYSPSANTLGITISGTATVTINSTSIQLSKNVTLGTNTSNQHILNTITSASVGATGAAEATPANPLGYWQVTINGVNCKIPYYTA
jgi:hypothetical protein